MTKEEGRKSVQALIEKFKQNRSEYVRSGSYYNETLLRNDFLNQFLIALGWDVFNERGVPQHLRDVIHESTVEVAGDDEGELLSKKPDYALFAGGQRKFFVEAKKPSVLIEGHKPSAFQVRRYGWSGGLPISVLTNFDKLIIYDCRPLPKAGDDVRIGRIKVYDFSEYAEKFDEIYDQLSCEAVYSGRFDETFGSREEYEGQTFDHYFLQQIEGWREALAHDLLQHNTTLTRDDLNFLIQRLINRILFLRICEDRTLEKAKALQEVRTYDDLKTVFLHADKRYNSGLFDFIEDKLSLAVEVSSDLLISIFKELYYPQSPYNFSVVESSLLGEVYELFLARSVELHEGDVRIVEKPEVIAAGGIVSTPSYIVDAIIQRTLRPFCEGKNPSELSELRVADIACGSGSFLVAAFEYLQQYHVEWYLSDGPEKHTDALYKTGSNEWRLTLPEKRRILQSNIFGVDIDIQAVEVTRFSLLLKALEDTTIGEVDAYLEKHGVQALPKLENNIQCGNSLVDGSYYQVVEKPSEDTVHKVNPFDWNEGFPTVMREGGFDLIIGNPPYIRIQNMVKYSPTEVNYYQSAASPFETAKSHNFDKYYLFIERAIALLKPTGLLGYIVPHKFSIIRAGQILRDLIASGNHLADFVHFGVLQVFGKRVTTYVCILRLSKEGVPAFTVERVSDLAKWRYGQQGTRAEFDAGHITGAPWTFIDDRSAALFERLRSGNVKSLDEVADIFVGVQTSADPLYIFRPTSEADNIVEFKARDGRRYRIERGVLRPCLYDVQFTEFCQPDANTYMIFPYKIIGGKAVLYSLEEMKDRFPECLKYLESCKDKLAERNVPKRTATNWYQFGRSQSLTKFNGEPKLIWPILMREPRYVYDDKDIIFTGGGNGPYYGLRMLEGEGLSLFYIQAILHHPVIDAMVEGSVFRGGYISHGKQYVAKLPIRTIDFESTKEVATYRRVVALAQELNVVACRAATANTLQKKVENLRRSTFLKNTMFRLIEALYDISKDDLKLVQEINE